MKKLTSLALSLCLVISALTVILPQRVSAAKPELSTMPTEQEVITIVGILEIMNGDYYGDLHLDDYVTRAEFTKMALSASSFKNSVNKASKISPFADIPASHWASGYIVTAVTNGYLRGYVDGTFRPNNRVTLEEAVTVMLRILGYTELDSGKYPSSQLAKYYDMKLDNMIGAKQGQALTRRECMYLIYNCLCAETKSGAVHCQTLGYTTDSNGRIDYLELIGKNMEGPVTVYDDNAYMTAVGIDMSRATVYRDGKQITVGEIQPYDQVYYNRDIRTLWCFSEKVVGTVNSITVAGITTTSPDYDGKASMSSPMGGSQTVTNSVYTSTSPAGTDTTANTNVYNSSSSSSLSDSIIVDGETYRLGNALVKWKFSQNYGVIKCDDFVMLMLDKDGNVGDVVIADKYIFDTYVTKDDEKTSIINASLKGPYTVTDPATLGVPFDINGASVYLNGKPASVQDIRMYDVYYYSAPFDSVWLYRDSKSGVVDSVNTGGVLTTSDDYNGIAANNNYVVVGGTSYYLGTEEVRYKFSAYGSISCDDFVLLLFGRDGNVADAVLLSGDSSMQYMDEKEKIDIMNSTRKGPYAVTDVASVKSVIPFDLASANIYFGTKTIDASQIALYDVFYYSEPFRSVWIYRDNDFGVVDSVNVSGVLSKADGYSGVAAVTDGIVISGKSYALSSDEVKNKFSAYGSLGVDDFVMVMLDKDGKVADAIKVDASVADNYVTDEQEKLSLINSTLKGPYTAMDASTVDAKVSFDLNTAKIYYGTKTIAPAEISKYDIFYYSEPFESVWIYRDNAIGMVDSVNVSGVSSVSARYSGSAAVSDGIILSGKSYALGSDTATYKFSAYGSLGIDDFIMVLLDKDGRVADAVTADNEILEKFLDEDDDRVALINSTLKGPYVVKSGESVAQKLPFDINGANIYHGTKSVPSSYIKTNDVYYYSVPFNSVWLYRDTATGFVNAVAPSRENPTAVSIGTKTYTLEGSEVKQQFSNFGSFEEDDFVTVLLGNGGTAVYAMRGDIYDYAANNKDGVSYADLVAQSMDGPVIVKPGKDWESELPFEASSATYYKKNSVTTKDSVSEYDVIYYSKALTSVWIYTDKATGTFEGVSPNRISPASVTVSGKSYPIESTGASFALSNMGTYSFGDTVTLLLGKDGGVVEVIPGADTAEASYGFITAFGEGSYTKPSGVAYTAENITILGTDTVSRTYEYDDSGFTKGDFVSVTYVDGKVKISKVTGGVSSAQAATVNSLVSAGSFDDDAVLLDVYVTTDSDSLKNKSIEYCKLYPSRLKGANIGANNIYYADVRDGKIKTLVLKDFTGDMHQYGVITAEREDGEIVYKVIKDGAKSSTAISTAYGTPKIGPAKLLLRSEGSISGITDKYLPVSLTGVPVTGSDFGRGYCISGGKTYNYASNVQFYIKTNGREFMLSTYDEMLEGSYTITAYYDDTEANGGRVRIIIAE